MRPYLWMMCAAVAFASMGAFANALRETCPWQVIALARSIVPLIITGTLVLAAGLRLPFPAPPSLWARSLAGSVSLILTFYALTRLPVSEVLTLSNLTPLWIAALSWPLLRQPTTPDLWLSVIAGVTGMILSQQEQMLHGNFASLAAIVASLASGVALINLHRLEGLDPRAIVFHFSSVSLALCLLTCVHMPDLDVQRVNTLATWLMLLAVGLSATIGQFCLTQAYLTGNPAKVSVVGLSQVGLGMLYDVYISRVPFTLVRFGGLMLLLGSTAWVLLSLGSRKLNIRRSDIESPDA